MTQKLPPIGARVVVTDLGGPTMIVVRHTRYDNGEVECIYTTADGVIARAWIPAVVLSVEHVPFFGRKDMRRFQPRGFA